MLFEVSTHSELTLQERVEDNGKISEKLVICSFAQLYTPFVTVQKCIMNFINTLS